MTSTFEHEGQFLIAGNERPLNPEATRYKIGPMFVDIFRGAKVVEAYDRAGQPVGLFIGTLIDTDRETIIDDRVVFDAEITSAEDIDQFVEQQVYRFAGTFLFILAVLNQRRIYLDANDPDPLCTIRWSGLRLQPRPFFSTRGATKKGFSRISTMPAV